MKKYFLILVTGFLFLTPMVKAEEYNTCFDKYLIGNVSLSRASTYWYSISPLVPVDPSSTYYLRFFISEDFTSANGTRFSSTPIGYDMDKNSLGVSNISNYSWDSEYQIFTFTTSNTESLSFLQIKAYNNNTNYTILENSYFIISDNKDDVISCPITEPEEPDPPFDFGDQPSIISNFYSICLDKIDFLATSFSENYILFCIPVISILVFVFILIRRFFI